MTESRPAAVVVSDALLVTQDARRTILRGDLRIENGRLVQVGGHASREGAEVIEGAGFAVVPGFINAHTHVAMSLLRGIADDRDLAAFLQVLFAVDTQRTESDVEAGARAGIAEMLLSGTTTFLDLYYAEDAIARAVEKLGIRGHLGWAILDPELTTQKGVPVENAERFVHQWKSHELVTPLFAPQGVYVCSQETWLASRDRASRSKSSCHFHLAETRKEVYDHEAKTGKRPAAWLAEIDFYRPGMVAAHGVWLTRAEVETLASRGVAVAHCASSNLKLASGGVAPVVELRSAGTVVGLGTDSVASNNSLSMLREMHTAGLLQKNHRWDAAALPASSLLDMATIDGARLLGREKELGSLEAGKLADFSLVRLDHPTLLPARPEAIVSHLAYSASEEAVDSVFVAGHPVVRNRRLLTADWSEIRRGAEAAAERLWSSRP